MHRVSPRLVPNDLAPRHHRRHGSRSRRIGSRRLTARCAPLGLLLVIASCGSPSADAAETGGTGGSPCTGTVITLRYDEDLDCTVNRGQVVDVRWPRQDFARGDVESECLGRGGELGVDDVFDEFVCKDVDIAVKNASEPETSPLESLRLDVCDAMIRDDEAAMWTALARYAEEAGISEQEAAGAVACF